MTVRSKAEEIAHGSAMKLRNIADDLDTFGEALRHARNEGIREAAKYHDAAATAWGKREEELTHQLMVTSKADTPRVGLERNHAQQRRLEHQEHRSAIIGLLDNGLVDNSAPRPKSAAEVGAAAAIDAGEVPDPRKTDFSELADAAAVAWAVAASSDDGEGGGHYAPQARGALQAGFEAGARWAYDRGQPSRVEALEQALREAITALRVDAHLTAKGWPATNWGKMVADTNLMAERAGRVLQGEAWKPLGADSDHHTPSPQWASEALKLETRGP